MNKQLRLIFASACAATITIAFVAVIVIWAELSSPLKGWLTNFSGHHWITKSIFSVLVYMFSTVLLYVMFRAPSENRIRKAIIFLLISTALGVITLMAFFIGVNFHLL